MPQQVRYDLSHPVVCEEHCIRSTLVCCPFPGCPNGTPLDDIEITSFAGQKEIYHRAAWAISDHEKTYSWENQFPRWFAISHIFWREAMRQGLTRKYEFTRSSVAYHYTNPDGLLGIVKNNNLWLTDYSYLNDTTELSYGLELAKAHFKSVAEKVASAAHVLNLWGNTIDGLSSRVSICSFSEDGDSLSQWRAYGPISIGFNLASQAFFSPSAVIRRIIYDPAIQATLIELMAHLCASGYEADAKTFPKQGVDDLYADGSDRVLGLTAFFKDPAFNDEREIRIVNVENPRIMANLGVKIAPKHFRVARDVLVPYVTTSDVISENAARLPIEEVIIGPHRHADVLERGIKELLSTHHYNSVMVRRSKTPLRPA